MIRLTRLDGQPFILNAELIRYVERRPDTYITLTSGERIVVGESMERVVELALEYQQRKAMLPSFASADLKISEVAEEQYALEDAGASRSEFVGSE